MVDLHTSNGRFRYASQIVVGYATNQPSERLQSQRGDFVYLAWPSFRDASPELVDHRWHLLDDDLRWVATTSFHLPSFNGVDVHTRHVQNNDQMRGHGFAPRARSVEIADMRPRAAVDFYQERVPANTGRFVFLPQNDGVPVPSGTLLNDAAVWPLSWDVVLLEPVPGIDVMHMPSRRRVRPGTFVDSDSESDGDDDGEDESGFVAPEPALPVPWVPCPQHALDPAMAKGPQFKSMHWSYTTRPFDHFGSCPVEELPVKGTRIGAAEEKQQQAMPTTETPHRLATSEHATMWQGTISATAVATMRMLGSRPQISNSRAHTNLHASIERAQASVARMQVETQQLERTFRESADATQRLERSFQESADVARRMADLSETLRDMVQNYESSVDAAIEMAVEHGTILRAQDVEAREPGSMMMIHDEIRPDPIHEEYRLGPRGRVRARAAAERAQRTREMEVAMFGAQQSRGRYERRRDRR